MIWIVDTKKLPILAVFVLSLAATSVHAANFDYLHEHLGKTTATVSGSHKSLSKADSVVFKSNLERLYSLLAHQPTLSGPKGVEIKGYFRPNDYQPKSTKVPITGFGVLRFHAYFRDKKTGKPVQFGFPTDEMGIAVNDPDKGPEVCSVPSSPTRVFCEPTQVEELDGFPVFRFNGMDVLVLSRSKVPVWIPLTREEFIKAWLATWKKQAAESPAIDTITPQIMRNHQAALDAMTPEERQMQAREFIWDPMQPNLAPVGSSEGRPLLKVNPAWFDPTLPRSSFQLITITFSYSGTINEDAPGATEFGDIAPLRVWQALRQSDWRKVSGVLAVK